MLGQDAGGAPRNVLEDWAIYDAIQIRKNATEKEGFVSYNALALKDEIPFFDQRKADVGLAYTNRDSNEGLEFAFFLKQVGVRFIAPPFHTEQPNTTFGADNVAINGLFSFLIEHAGFVLKIREDDKLRHTVTLAPGGGGEFGFVTNPGNTHPTNTIQNGEPFFNNRWMFSGDGIPMPRGCTFNVRLRFSEYAKTMMKTWPGPGVYKFSNNPNAEIEIPSCGLIRFDLIGWREVQQRGDLHY